MPDITFSEAESDVRTIPGVSMEPSSPGEPALRFPSENSSLETGEHFERKPFSFSTGPELDITGWNREIAEFTGRAGSYVLGRKYYDVLPRIIVDDGDAVRAAVKGKTSFSFDNYPLNCLNGQMTADIRIVPVSGPEGDVHRVDITIVPSSPCTAIQKLESARRLIDIGKMASTLAHGVRNPLNAIKGAVVYLRERYQQEHTLMEFTQLMEEEIVRLDTFVSTFLSTSMTEAALAESDVNALLRKMEVFVSLQLHSSRIRAVFQYGDVPAVRVNAFHLEQAVMNVVNNAIEAMRSEGQLAVRSFPEVRSAMEYAVVEVSDTGPGMSNAVEDFSSPQRKGEGRGFGLFITREVLQHYGGHMEIQSIRGEGTTVRLFIPAEPARRS